MKNGIYGIPFDEYLETEGISNSYLSRFAVTPAHATIPMVETPSMAIGTAFHTCVLEPDQFDSRYAVLPALDRRTKAGKADFAEFQAENQGKVFIKPADFEAIQNMRVAILDHPAAKKLLQDGMAEQSVFWNDSATELQCKARPDWLTRNTVVDLKKTRDASERGFARSVVQYRYYQQAAMYLDGINQVSDTEYNEFVFIAVCDQEPYEIGVYSLSQEFLEFGYSEYRRLLDKVRLHQELNLFPNFNSAGVVEIKKPAYLS